MMNEGWLELNYKSQSAEEAFYVKFLDRYVIGQERAKKKLAAKLAAYRHGLSDKDKPACVLLLPGPSGVGKTSIVRAFTKLLIGDLNGFTKVDCANLQHEHTDAILLGSPPGYVGYKEEAVFSQKRLNAPWKENHPYKTTKEDEEKLKEIQLSLFETKLDLDDLLRDLTELDKLEKEIEKKIKESKDEETKEELKEQKKRLEPDRKALEAKVNEMNLLYSQKQEEVDQFIKNAREEYDRKICDAVVLFDEIEKIHPKITRILLSIYDTGETKISNGEKSDFRNCFIFMTSNIGSEQIAEMLSGKKRGLGFSLQTDAKKEEEDLDKKIYQTVMEEVKKSNCFPTELVGRIGKENIIVFHPLSTENIRAIIDFQLSELQNKLTSATPKTKLIFSQALKDFIFEETQDPLNKALGARPIENVIKAKLLEPLLNLIIKGETDGGITPGDLVRIDVREGSDKKKKIVILKKRC